MNINRIIILWIMLCSVSYAAGIIPQWGYIAGVAPAILVHAWRSGNEWQEMTPTNPEEKPSVDTGPDPVVPFDAEEIVVDEEFETRIELSVGGHAYLEGWKERTIPAEQVKSVNKNDDGYDRLSV